MAGKKTLVGLNCAADSVRVLARGRSLPFGVGSKNFTEQVVLGENPSRSIWRIVWAGPLSAT